MVNPETNNKITFNQQLKEGLRRNNKYTRAVTKVQECTETETGVGAAMAAGNQEKKGI
jgi:hypothetical protein